MPLVDSGMWAANFSQVTWLISRFSPPPDTHSYIIYLALSPQKTRTIHREPQLIGRAEAGEEGEAMSFFFPLALMLSAGLRRANLPPDATRMQIKVL